MNASSLGVTKSLVLVTGATGYIGGRLVPRLLKAGYRVRCLVRDATRLQDRLWRNEVEAVEGDVLRPDSLADAMQGTVVAYYLVHSLGTGADFSERDAQAASNFGASAKSAGVKRIIYLGGLGDPAAANAGRKWRHVPANHRVYLLGASYQCLWHHDHDLRQGQQHDDQWLDSHGGTWAR